MSNCSNTANLFIGTNSYNFVFLGVSNPSPSIYRWCYEVTVTTTETGRGLSHFILGFCPTITSSNISNVTVTANGTTTAQSFEFGNIKIFPPATTPSIYGIKFNDVGLGNGQSAIYCFDLNVNVEPAPGDLSIKTGSGPASPDTVVTVPNAICTPGCETPPPPTRGFKLFS